MSSKSKKFSEKYLKQNGVDAEAVKEEYVDKISHYDIYNGETITIESKDGRDIIDTKLTKDEFFAIYGNQKEECDE